MSDARLCGWLLALLMGAAFAPGCGAKKNKGSDAPEAGETDSADDGNDDGDAGDDDGGSDGHDDHDHGSDGGGGQDTGDGGAGDDGGQDGAGDDGGQDDGGQDGAGDDGDNDPPSFVATIEGVQAWSDYYCKSCHVEASRDNKHIKIDKIPDIIRTKRDQSTAEKLIVPGNPGKSPFLLSLSRRFSYIAPDASLMPKGSPPLPDTTVDQIEAWIRGLCEEPGAQESYEDCRAPEPPPDDICDEDPWYPDCPCDLDPTLPQCEDQIDF